MNLFDMVKNLQGQMGDIQGRLKNIVAEGASGGELVKLTVNGQMEILALTIAPEIVDPNETGVLQDLIIAAFNDAFRKIREATVGELGNLGAGLGGLNLPSNLFGPGGPLGGC
jgi:DNA-binding YbaB/EbfC family protein